MLCSEVALKSLILDQLRSREPSDPLVFQKIIFLSSYLFADSLFVLNMVKHYFALNTCSNEAWAAFQSAAALQVCVVSNLITVDL